MSAAVTAHQNVLPADSQPEVTEASTVISLGKSVANAPLAQEEGRRTASEAKGRRKGIAAEARVNGRRAGLQPRANEQHAAISLGKIVANAPLVQEEGRRAVSGARGTGKVIAAGARDRFTAARVTGRPAGSQPRAKEQHAAISLGKSAVNAPLARQEGRRAASEPRDTGKVTAAEARATVRRAGSQPRAKAQHAAISLGKSAVIGPLAQDSAGSLKASARHTRPATPRLAAENAPVPGRDVRSARDSKPSGHAGKPPRNGHGTPPRKPAYRPRPGTDKETP